MSIPFEATDWPVALQALIGHMNYSQSSYPFEDKGIYSGTIHHPIIWCGTYWDLLNSLAPGKFE